MRLQPCPTLFSPAWPSLRPIAVLVLSLVVFSCAQAADGDEQPFWWDDSWWNEGILHADLQNHPVRSSNGEYPVDGASVPYTLMRPDDDAAYPAVVWVHGRRGLDDLALKHVRRLAARGFVVFAPDLYTGRFIETHPIDHDEILERDLADGVEHFAGLDGRAGTRACFVSITRGGYYSLRAAVTHQQQDDAIACWVGYYPHVQNPNLGEPYQVYRYANEFNELTIPVMVLIGEEEQYQRLRSARMAADGLRARGGDVIFVEYPGVGRGFDFRNGSTRTFADDLAARDAMLRTATFLRRHLDAVPDANRR